MKGTKILTAVGLLAALQLATVGMASAGDPFRVRVETSTTRAKIDVDVRGLTPNSFHTVRLSASVSCSQSFTRSADLNGELDLRTDTNVNDENNLNACFKGAASVNVTLDGSPLGSGTFPATQK